MLGKKMGVLFTISSVNFELKQGKEYQALQLLRILHLSPTRARVFLFLSLLNITKLLLQPLK